MFSQNASCLTRVMIDDDCALEVAQLQSVMHRIQCMLHDVPQAQREYIANALLNLAVSRYERLTPQRFPSGWFRGSGFSRTSESFD